MKFTTLLVACCLQLLYSCTSVKNGATSACEDKILIFNTGLTINGDPSNYGVNSFLFSLLADNTRDNKWQYCMVNYDDLNPFPTNYATYNFKCQDGNATLIRPGIINGTSADNGTAQGLFQTNNSWGETKWVVADAGRIVHTTPYYHIFTNAFCLTAQEKGDAQHIKLNIQTFDSPIISVIVNNNTIWSNTTPGTYTFILQNFMIPKTNLRTGVNDIRIVTIKQNTRSDGITSNDGYCSLQETGLDVSGYLRIVKCCN